MTTADRIKNRRLELGLTQLEVAKRLGLTSKAAVCKVEKQGDEVTLKNVEKFAKALDCSVLYIMGWENREINNVEPSDDKVIREAKFSKLYSQLNEDQKKLVDDMILALSEKK